MPKVAQSCSCLTAHEDAAGALGHTESQGKAPRVAGLSTLRALRADPTRTKTLRDAFEAEMVRRFRKIKKLIWESVYVNDCFGLKEKKPGDGLQLQVAAPPGAFAYGTSSDKVNGFMGWLGEQTDKYILSDMETGGKVNKGMRVIRGAPKAVAGQAAWTDLYIASGYKKGLQRAYGEMEKAGYMVVKPRSVEAIFNTPMHADRVGAIYTRTYNELKGITDAMDQQISRSLAESIAEGRHPMQMARIMMNRVEKVGDLATTDSLGRFIPALRRARMLARTETIRAHHVATINTYEAAGVEGVIVQAEWSTAGDDRVCPDCESLEAKEFTLKEIRGMIPRHPLCRCCALPVNVKIDKKKVKDLYGEDKLTGFLPPLPKGADLNGKVVAEMEAQGWFHPDDLPSGGWQTLGDGSEINWATAYMDPHSFAQDWAQMTGKPLPASYLKVIQQIANGKHKFTSTPEFMAVLKPKLKQAYHAKSLHVKKAILKKASAKRIVVAKKVRAEVVERKVAGLPPAPPKAAHVTVADIPNDSDGAVVFGKRLTATAESPSVTPGGSSGSTGAKVFLDDEGARWIVKDYGGNTLQVESEWVANRLYALNNINVPEARLAILPDGRKVVCLRKLTEKGLVQMGEANVDWAASSAIARRGFSTDCLVGNWDVAGTGWDNILCVPTDKRLIWRIDQGGCLFFRAQGGMKGADFGRAVMELKSLREAGFNGIDNHYAVRFFARLTDKEIVAQINTMTNNITNTRIASLVRASGMARDKADELITILQERLSYLRQWGRDTGKALKSGALGATRASLTASDAPISPKEWDTIVAARGNGVAYRWDAGQIEDQQVHFWIETRADGKRVLKAWFKVRGSGVDAVAKLHKGGAMVKGTTIGLPPDRLTSVTDKCTTAIKGIASRAAKGEGLMDYDLTRVAEAEAEFKAVLSELRSLVKQGYYKQGAVTQFESHYEPWIRSLKDSIKGKKAGQVFTWAPPQPGHLGKAQLPAAVNPKAAPSSAPAPTTIRLDGQREDFHLSNIDRGHVSRTTQLSYADGDLVGYDAHTGRVDNVTVRSFIQDPKKGQTVANLVSLEIEDVSQVGAQKLIDTIGRIGVVNRRPTALEAEDLYLRHLLYGVRDAGGSRASWWAGVKAELDGIDDVAVRVARARELLVAEMPGVQTVDDLLRLPGYNVEGEWGAFNHGSIRWTRPDLHGKAWETFCKDYVVHHNLHGGVETDLERILNSGGVLVSNSNKMRMGIPPGGMSPSHDIWSGGGDYAYTRIYRSTDNSTGLFWNARVLARTDAMSWTGDTLYTSGRLLEESFVMEYRRTGIEGWKACAARSSNNETLFKGGLSLLQDLDRIVVPNSGQKARVIDMLKRHGYTQLSGKPLDAIVVVQ